jgi:hypothetical protein
MLYKTAKIGTEASMPANPKKPPPTKIANIIQNEDSPRELPRIFGPRILPSNC